MESVIRVESDFIQDVLAKHLQTIIAGCKQLFPHPNAIVLHGGYGRDEGGWFRDEEDKWAPYNDYDIYVISDKVAGEKDLKTLEKSLAKEVGIRWIDLTQLSHAQMKRLRPTIKNYDLKYGSKVIEGDPSVLNLIPAMSSSSLPLTEVQTLFFTRLYTIIGSLGEGGLATHLKGDESRFFRNQMAKAVLAVVDVLLLSKGAYDASYRKRVESIQYLYPDKKRLLELSQWALTEKLWPQAPDMSPQELFQLYSPVHEHFLREMYYALSTSFGRKIKGPENIEFCAKWLPWILMKRLYWLVKFRGSRMEKKISVKLAQSYIAAAWSPEVINDALLRQGVKLLRQADSSVRPNLSWDQARLEAARVRMEN